MISRKQGINYEPGRECTDKGPHGKKMRPKRGLNRTEKYESRTKFGIPHMNRTWFLRLGDSTQKLKLRMKRDA